MFPSVKTCGQPKINNVMRNLTLNPGETARWCLWTSLSAFFFLVISWSSLSCLEDTEGWNKPKYSLNRLLSLKAHHCKSNNPNILNKNSIFTIMRALNLYQQSTDSRLTIRFRCSVDMKCMVSYIQVCLSDNLCLGLFINDVITWGGGGEGRWQTRTW